MQAKALHGRRKKREDLMVQLQCIAQIQKAFLEGYVQIVLVNMIQPKILGESRRTDGGSSSTTEADECRTILQYLIEVVEAI